MTARDDLSQAIGEYEALLLQFKELDPDISDHRREAIQLRRQFTDILAAILASGEAAFAGTELGGQFRSEFSKMRSAVAYHQASWPIVAVDHDDAAYCASEATTRDACHNFIAWARNALDLK
jgi:hypothetical protein